MGCYWSCDANFEIHGKEMESNVRRWLDRRNDDEDFETDITNDCFRYEIDDAGLSIWEYEHHSYDFGEEFRSFVCHMAEKFGLTGELFIRTDEDGGEPPWKTTWEDGHTVNWKAEVIYTRVEE